MNQQPTTYEVYAGQFATLADPLSIAIPREELIAHMVTEGEVETLDRICVAVAVVLDAITSASLEAA